MIAFTALRPGSAVAEAVLSTAEELLADESALCWKTLTDFWAAVAEWCAENRPPLASSEEILPVQKEQLRDIPGFSHIAAALRRT